ncbi:pilus assembly protein, PilQ [Moraxella macacae 0408225]|uniref:Pilus assembly protein, PilQ n=1 Tax=Moraxella macacae 0408225 TaxID=1230338 RepID=L2F8S5_9GAMM|nr:pilus assembly protein PilP [Moraxella macacae]ELA09442.1 pilus assembly protein, PilQ [Moraxella macacae 0408225]
MRKNNYSILCCLLAGFVLAGCADNRISMAEQEMQTIRESSAQPIEPPPQPQVVQAFDYNANQLRSPFMPPSLTLKAAEESQIQAVHPDETRIREPLESFDLDQLTYIGNVVSDSGEISALIKTPEGRVASVKVGNYLGKNHGQIQQIVINPPPPDKYPYLEIIEILPDSRVGYSNQTVKKQLTAS